MAVRSLVKHRLHSVINILGLAVGICLSLIIVVFALGELSINTGLKNIERQYVIESEWSSKGSGVDYTTLGPLSASLHANYPGLVSNHYRFSLATAIVSSAPDRVFKEELQISDTTMLSMFGFEVLHGSKESAFRNNGIVMTASMAKKLFNRENALGEVLTIRTNDGEELPFSVTAVMEDLPFNSITNFTANPNPNQLFVSMAHVKNFSGKKVDELWDFRYMVSVVELADGVSPADLQQPMEAIINTNAPKEISQTLKPKLAPLASYYLNREEGKALKMAYTLSLIALFIMLLATANFVGMMITKSSGRLREIGVRRLLGEERWQLMIQFLTESIILALIALVLALGFYQVSYIYVGSLLDKTLPPVWEFSLLIFAVAAGLAVLIGVLAGLYPSLRLSGTNLSVAVKGNQSATGEGRLVRKLLISFQIGVATFVLFASFVITKQYTYLKEYPLGYDKEGILVISSVPRSWNEEGVNKLNAVRFELEQLPDVGVSTASYEVPDGNAGNRFSFFASGQNSTQKFDMPLLKTDESFAETYGLEMVSGTYFHNKREFRPNEIIINETAARGFGWNSDSALGRQINWEGNEKPFTVVGVVKDFNFYSLSESMSPLAIIHLRNWNIYRYLSVKVNGEHLSHVAGLMEDKWSKLYPGAPFDYLYMEDKVEQFYEAENRVLGAFRFANFFTIIITLTGIAAFMSFSLLKRRKELGVRLVLGASKASLVLLYLRGFWLHFVFACLGAFSFSYYFLDGWLENFYYRIQIPFVQFAGVGIAIVLLVSLIITAHILRVSGTNLIRALKAD